MVTRIVVELFDGKTTAPCLIETANRLPRRYLFGVGSTRPDNANSSEQETGFIGCNCEPFYHPQLQGFASAIPIIIVVILHEAGRRYINELETFHD
jgi:hypothetical protein